MLTFSVLLLWAVVAYGGTTLQVSYQDCTRANAKAKLNKVVFIPAEPKIGQNFTYVFYLFAMRYVKTQ